MWVVCTVARNRRTEASVVPRGPPVPTQVTNATRVWSGRTSAHLYVCVVVGVSSGDPRGGRFPMLCPTTQTRCTLPGGAPGPTRCRRGGGGRGSPTRTSRGGDCTGAAVPSRPSTRGPHPFLLFSTNVKVKMLDPRTPSPTLRGGTKRDP